MTRNWFANVLNFFKGLKGSTKFVLLSLLCATIAFAFIAINEDWSKWVASEEDYNALGQIVYDMSEDKSFTQPLSEALERYDVSVYSDGTINIHLYSHDVEYLSVKLSENYEIQHFARHSQTFEYVLALIISLALIGAYWGLIIVFIFWIFKGIYIIIKRKP